MITRIGLALSCGVDTISVRGFQGAAFFPLIPPFYPSRRPSCLSLASSNFTFCAFGTLLMFQHQSDLIDPSTLWRTSAIVCIKRIQNVLPGAIYLSPSL